MIKLNSGISREIPGHFILTENALRAISNILEKRAKDLPYPCAVIFHVKRVDDRFYETERVDEVLGDANTTDRQIEQIKIELRNADPSKVTKPWERDWIVAVHFNSKAEEQKIDVASEDKDWALLVSDEVEPQIVKTLTAKKIHTWLLLPFYLAIAYGLQAVVNALSVENSGNTILHYAPLAIWGPAAILTIMTLERSNEKLKKWIGPESSFNWGEQAASFNHREQLRQNLFWGVIVGSAVSALSGYLINVALPPPKEITSSSTPKVSTPPQQTTTTQKQNSQ